MTYLLDVNALIAILWASHEHHDAANRWVAGKKLAVCPLSELGYLRITTNKPFCLPMEDARENLKDFVELNNVSFVAADLPALRANASDSAQVTDMYLATLADANGMKLATFDRKIDHRAAEVIYP